MLQSFENLIDCDPAETMEIAIDPEGQAKFSGYWRCMLFFVSILFLFVCLASISHAALDKIWNDYQTPLFSGSYSYGYKIDLPSGTRGMRPQLAVSYNSFLAGNKGGWVGAGWEIPLSYVQTNTDSTFSLFLDGARHDLVYLASEGRYHTKIETFLKIGKNTGAANEKSEFWTVFDTNGTEYRFGYNLDSENMINKSLVTPYVWRWSLDRITDRNGNSVYITYSENPTANDRGAVYLSRIEYNTEKKRLVEFVLEDFDRPDVPLIVDQGSEVQVARRLAEINVSVNGQLAKKIAFQYALNATSDTSFLSSITKYGSDGVTALPPEVFEYTSLTDGTGTKTDLLTRIAGALGDITTVGYSPSSTAPNTSFPENYWLVTSISQANGMTGPHALSAASTLAYENGVYDTEFRGFGKVTETRPDGSKVVHTFLQDDATKGREQRSAVSDAQNAPYLMVVNFWTSTLADGVHTVRLEKTEGYTYDGVLANPKITRSEYKNFDVYGNAGLEIDHGDIAVSGDETYTTREFVVNPDLWIVNKVKHLTVAAAENGTKLRESWFYYDRAFDLDSPPFDGNLTKEEHWNNTGTNPAVTYKYDAFGNLTRKTDPLGNSVEIVYDAVYNTFPELVYNAKNHLTTTSFNPVAGKPVSVTDPNGNTTTYAYDVFNRLTKIVKPYDSESFPTTEMQYVINSAPPHLVIVKNRETAGGGGTLDALQIIDGLGKTIQTKSEYDASLMITSDTYYDIMGRVAEQSNVYLTAYAMGYSTPDTGIPSSQTGYDIIGRPILITNPDNTFSTVSYDHWTSTTVDENGHAKTQAFDSNRKLVQVLEHNQGETYTTRYQYSPLGELLAIIDHLGNTSTHEFDSLGRNIKTVDVDLGQRLFSYDLAGNTISQTDARGIVIKYQYDVLNRQTLIDYPNDKDIQFVYDLNTDPSNPNFKGVLSRVYQGLGSDSFKYDRRMRKVQEDRTMDNQTWTTKWEYDSMDRVIRQIYPDGEIVQYSFNTQDKLSGIQRASQILQNNMTYNASGLMTQKSYGNGWNTVFTYDPANLRLTGISTTKGTGKLQDLAYTYDNSDNMKTLKSVVDGSSRTETFAYDDLYRLVNARDDLATGGFDNSYVYNAVGNMTKETDNKTGAVTQYTYGQGTAKPHAVTGKTDSMPNVGSFVIENGKAFCTRQQVTLNNISMGNPTEYMASENQDFTGASWQSFSTAPVFTLSAGFGNKFVYFKVKNAGGESKVKSDDILYYLDTDADGIPDADDADMDNDGIPNAADAEPLNAANALLDPDGDGLTNLQEYQYGTKPNLKDSDGDGWNDDYEIFTSKTNPNSADTDKDGIPDPTDTSPNNPYNEGFSQNYSVKRWTFNGGGGRRSSTNYAAADKLCSGFSKSPLVDTDGDGIPDAWEIAHGLDPTKASDAMLDIDGDGLTNLQEYIYGTKPSAKDSDGDGWSDYQEIFIHDTDPNAKDSDNDGIPDVQDPEPNKQTYIFGTSENYMVRNGNFNAGGNNRSSAAYLIVPDRIGGLMNNTVTYNASFFISPATVNFESTETNQTRTATLTITNNGIENLIIGTVSLEGSDVAEFSILQDNCSAHVFSPSVSSTIQISFMPKSPGGKGARLVIQYNDGENKVADIPVSGIATIASTPAPTIAASAGTGGNISPSGNVTVDYGATQVFTITPNAGYSVSTVTVDGAPAYPAIPATGGNFTFTNVTADHTISAVFTTFGVKGDINGDGKVDLTDVILCLQVLSGLAPDNINSTADVNGDEKIGMAEAIYAMQKAAGLR